MSKDSFNKNLDILIDKIVDSILGTKSEEEAAAMALWPIPTPYGLLFWGDGWSQKLYQVLILIGKQKISDYKIQQALKYPSRVVQMLRRLDALKDSKLSLKQQLFVIERLFKYLKLFRKKNLWCDGGENQIWQPKEVRKHIKRLTFFPLIDESIRKEISSFEANLLLFTELLYWANHPLGHSFHGPYKSSKDIVLMREYYDLKPEVWRFTGGLKFSEIEIMEKYKSGTRLFLDAFERGIHTVTPFKKGLISFAVKIDGKPINSLSQLKKARTSLDKVFARGAEFIQSLNTRRLVKKHAEYWFYAIKPLCNLVDVDWHLPDSVTANVNQKFHQIHSIWEEKVKEKFEETATLPLGEQAKILTKLFDPRIKRLI